MAMPVFSEDNLSETPAIEQLKKLGYDYIYGDKLGTWQQIVFMDFDNRRRDRKIVVQIIGA